MLCRLGVGALHLLHQAVQQPAPPHPTRSTCPGRWQPRCRKSRAAGPQKAGSSGWSAPARAHPGRLRGIQGKFGPLVANSAAAKRGQLVDPTPRCAGADQAAPPRSPNRICSASVAKGATPCCTMHASQVRLAVFDLLRSLQHKQQQQGIAGSGVIGQHIERTARQNEGTAHNSSWGQPSTCCEPFPADALHASASSPPSCPGPGSAPTSSPRAPPPPPCCPTAPGSPGWRPGPGLWPGRKRRRSERSWRRAGWWPE